MATILQWLHKDDVCTTIQLTDDGMVQFENHTSDPFLCAFGTLPSPVDFGEFDALLKTRFCPKRGKYADYMLAKNLGIDKAKVGEQLVDINHGMVIDDFFWLKAPEENLTFAQVRSKLGISGKKTSWQNLSTKPLRTDNFYSKLAVTTKASQVKYAKNGWLIKRDTYACEGLCEALNYLISRYVKDLDILEYRLLPQEVEGRGVCASPIFTDSNDIEIFTQWDIIQKFDLYPVLSMYQDNGAELLAQTIAMTSDILGITTHDYIHRMLMWDALTMNLDRHYNNWGFGRRQDGTFCYIPYYDQGLTLHGYSLLGIQKGVKECVYDARPRMYAASFDDLALMLDSSLILQIDLDGLVGCLKRQHKKFRKIGGVLYEEYVVLENFLYKRLRNTEGTIWKENPEKPSTAKYRKYFEQHADSLPDSCVPEQRHLLGTDTSNTLAEEVYGNHYCHEGESITVEEIDY
jgi:hypothetical protein